MMMMMKTTVELRSIPKNIESEFIMPSKMNAYN
jgi:hypothetical protein